MRELVVRDFMTHHCCQECGRPFEQQSEKDGMMLTLITLWHKGNSVRLTIQTSNIIRELLKAYPAVISREYLFNKVWGGDSDVEDKILDVFMCNLRKKLVKIDLGIENIWGVGFRLVKK